jgi:hypothetical protein
MMACVRTLEDAPKSLLVGTHVPQGDDILTGLLPGSRGVPSISCFCTLSRSFTKARVSQIVKGSSNNALSISKSINIPGLVS